MTRVYQVIARKLDAIRNCEASDKPDWGEVHSDALESLIRDRLPSGSGFDSGTQFDIADHVDSKADKLTFTTVFHHMDGNGFYSGWTNHKVIVTPSLAFGFVLRVTGRDRNGIKDYIGDVFHSALNEELAS